MTPGSYNEKSGLILACPITSIIKGYPFEVVLPESNSVSGVVLADQVRSLDWRERKAELVEKAGKEVVREVIEKVLLLIL